MFLQSAIIRIIALYVNAFYVFPSVLIFNRFSREFQNFQVPVYFVLIHFCTHNVFHLYFGFISVLFRFHFGVFKSYYRCICGGRICNRQSHSFRTGFDRFPHWIWIVSALDLVRFRTGFGSFPHWNRANSALEFMR
jgi:hypothetical protein